VQSLTTAVRASDESDSRVPNHPWTGFEGAEFQADRRPVCLGFQRGFAVFWQTPL